MYIKYSRTQREIWNSNGEVSMTAGFNNRLEASGVSDFKPAWLVRVADMEVIPGAAVHDHYWTLSYSWNQSGEIIKTGDEEYERIDEGKHTIIPKRKKKHLGNANTKVTFDKLVQHMCLDFGIKYLWYDQKCINQGDHDEKMREIRRMHLIYKNARCTLVVVPELEFTGKKDGENVANTDVLPTSQWSKRIWTLEEAYMSNHLLFVGRNVHLWLDFAKTDTWAKADFFLKNIRAGKKWKACTVLWYGRSRTSSKAHDRIFALVNIFPELKDGITFSYCQPLTDLMSQFYGLLAAKDISILIFGPPIDSEADSEFAARRQAEASFLPSWSGANGVHITQDQFLGEYIDPEFSWTVDGECMCVVSESIHVRIEPVASVERADPAEDPGVYTKDGLPRAMSVDGELLDENGSMEMTFVTIPGESHSQYREHTEVYGIKATHFLPAKEKDQAIVNTLSKPKDNGGFLSLTEECSECFILTGIDFYSTRYHFLPVVTKENDRYRSVGLCLFPYYVRVSYFLQAKQNFVIG